HNHFFSSLLHHPPSFSLFPYTTLFRSIAIFWPIPVDPSVSRRFSIFTRVCSDLSSSWSRPTSSFKTSTLVVLCSCRVMASSAKRSEEHTSELQSRSDLVCRLLLEKKK